MNVIEEVVVTDSEITRIIRYVPTDQEICALCEPYFKGEWNQGWRRGFIAGAVAGAVAIAVGMVIHTIL